MCFGVPTGRAPRDQTSDPRGALAPVKRDNFGALTDPRNLAELLHAVDAYWGTHEVRCALASIHRSQPLQISRHAH